MCENVKRLVTWFYKKCGSKYTQKYTTTLWRTLQTYYFFLSNQMAPACRPPPTNSPGPVPRSLWHHHPWGMAWLCLLIVLQLVTTQRDVTRVKETHSGSFPSIGTCLWKKYIVFAAEKVIVNPGMSTRFKKYLWVFAGHLLRQSASRIFLSAHRLCILIFQASN